MPLPEPKENESEKEFVSRCIHEISKNEEDKKKPLNQRVAICYSIYRKHKNNSK